MLKLFFIFLYLSLILPSVSFSKSKEHWLHVDGEKNFSNIIVISKKFLKKTNRLEVFTYGATSINNAFYLNAAPGLDITYYFKEKYGVSFSYLYFFNSAKEIKSKLDRSTLRAQLGFSPKQFVGMYFHWSPIYGKLAFFNKKLIPFDLYFALGLGQVSAEYRERNEGGEKEKITPFKSLSFSAQMGQQFAWSPDVAIHWKILWNAFPLPSGGKITGVANDILFGLGVSWFFGGKNTGR